MNDSHSRHLTRTPSIHPREEGRWKRKQRMIVGNQSIERKLPDQQSVSYKRSTRNVGQLSDSQLSDSHRYHLPDIHINQLPSANVKSNKQNRNAVHEAQEPYKVAYKTSSTNVDLMSGSQMSDIHLLDSQCDHLPDIHINQMPSANVKRNKLKRNAVLEAKEPLDLPEIHPGQPRRCGQVVQAPYNRGKSVSVSLPPINTNNRGRLPEELSPKFKNNEIQIEGEILQNGYEHKSQYRHYEAHLTSTCMFKPVADALLESEPIYNYEGICQRGRHQTQWPPSRRLDMPSNDDPYRTDVVRSKGTYCNLTQKQRETELDKKREELLDKKFRKEFRTREESFHKSSEKRAPDRKQKKNKQDYQKESPKRSKKKLYSYTQQLFECENEIAHLEYKDLPTIPPTTDILQNMPTIPPTTDILQNMHMTDIIENTAENGLDLHGFSLPLPPIRSQPRNDAKPSIPDDVEIFSTGSSVDYTPHNVASPPTALVEDPTLREELRLDLSFTTSRTSLADER